MLDFVFNVTITPAGGGGGGGGGAATSIALFLPDPVDQAHRQSYIDGHQLGTSSERAFVGFSAAEEAAMQSFTATTAAQWVTLMNTHAGTAVPTRILLEWNGISTYTPEYILGPNSSGLVANAAVDYGYNRKGSAILVKPAPGFSPVIGTVAQNFQPFYGLEKLELRNFKTDKMGIKFTTTPSYPSLAMVAITGASQIREAHFLDTGAITIAPEPLRTLHVDGLHFSYCRAGIVGGAQTRRTWNTWATEHGDNDFIGDRGYPSPLCDNWTVRTWTSGCMTFKARADLQTTSGLHPDFEQFTVSTANSNAPVRECITEFNISDFNRSANSLATQGKFGDDGDRGNFGQVIHNNMFGISAYHAIIACDPQGGGKKVVTNNLCFRSGNGPGADAGFATWQDSWPHVRGYSWVTPFTPGGYLKIGPNVSLLAASAADGAPNYTFTAGTNADPRLTAPAGSRYSDLFEGNGGGTGFRTDQHPAGYMTYDVGALITDTIPQARAKYRSFFRPKGGSWPLTAGSSGWPVDPDLWPTDPTTVG